MTETMYGLGGERVDDGRPQGEVVIPASLLPTPNPFHMTNDEEPAEWLERRAEVQDRTGTRHGPALPVVAKSVEAGHPLVQDGGGPRLVDEPDTLWGPYAAAIARHERTFGRVAPAPTIAGARGGRKLNPRFVEWMMALPDGWITDVPDLTVEGIDPTDKRFTKRVNATLKGLGNGVVPPQAAAAIRLLLDRFEGTT